MAMNKTTTHEIIIAPHETTHVNGVDNIVSIFYDVKMVNTSYCGDCIISEIKNKLLDLTQYKRKEEIHSIIVTAYKHSNVNVQDIVMCTDFKRCFYGDDLANYVFDKSLHEYRDIDLVLNICKCKIMLCE